jgi:hypothetical protein
MHLRLAILLLILIPALARAEDTPQIRAMSARIGAEINANLQCNISALELQDKLKAAEAEVKRLTDKYEKTEKK